MKKWLIEYLGGFPDVVSAVRYIKKSNNESAKSEILTETTKFLFNTIGPEDILRINKDGEYVFQGRVLMKEEVQELRAEAKLWMSSKLWKVIDADVKFTLNRKMYLESNLTMDIMWGKLLQYYHDIINTRLHKLMSK